MTNELEARERLAKVADGERLSAVYYENTLPGVDLRSDLRTLLSAPKGEVVAVPQALFDEVFGAFIAMADPARIDPQHGREVAALGKRIGFGAMMCSASASWSQTDGVKGGEFSVGPCRATALRIRDELAAALYAHTGGGDE